MRSFLMILAVTFGCTVNPALGQSDSTSIQLFETLDQVNIGGDPGISLSKKAIITQELISEVELRKAACCDLSESFETNASISASFTDAVTGTRQIKLLGLEGPYALYTKGNVTTMGGLASVMGLAFIPGAWIQSIQLTKGPGSVVNGAGAISGQINYELRPSFTKQIGHVNLFAGPGRFEQNLIYTWHQSEKWSSNIMVHGRQQLFRWDGNKDGYLDTPLSQHFFVQNAWKFNGKNSEGQLGIKFSSADNIGGSTLYGKETFAPIWSHELQTDRYELWAKRGYFLKGGINRSIGTQFSANYQDLDSYFDERLFVAKEFRTYGNLIFQDNIIDTRRTIKAGADFNLHNVEQEMWGYNGDYDASTFGIYGEYSYVASPDGEGLSMILGQRLDQLNITGNANKLFYVPRLHVKYNSGAWSLRSQASRSYRYTTLGAEYMGYMANNRVFNLSSGSTPAIESSWTLGTSGAFTKDIAFKELQITGDVFLTKFDRKMTLDLDQDTETALFYNRSWTMNEWGDQPYSLSAQLGGQYELLHRTLFKFAYRYQKVTQLNLTAMNQGIDNELEEVILNVPHLLYGGISYTGTKGLGIELNATYNSSQRLPNAGYNDRSPAFTMLGGQVSKEFRKRGQIYLGLQNALNVRQLNPIMGGDLPFEDRFDASVVWGPIMGRQVYAGWRYDLRKP